MKSSVTDVSVTEGSRGGVPSAVSSYPAGEAGRCSNVLHTVCAWMRGDSLVRRRFTLAPWHVCMRYDAARQGTSCVCQWAAGGWFKTTLIFLTSFLRFHFRKKKLIWAFKHGYYIHQNAFGHLMCQKTFVKNKCFLLETSWSRRSKAFMPI